MIDESKTDEKRQKVKQCDDMAVDTASLDIACPADPQPAACDTALADVRPGSDAWAAREYSGRSWYGDAPTEASTPCPASPSQGPSPAPRFRVRCY